MKRFSWKTSRVEPWVRRFPVPVGSVFRADIFKSRVRGIPVRSASFLYSGENRSKDSNYKRKGEKT